MSDPKQVLDLIGQRSSLLNHNTVDRRGVFTCETTHLPLGHKTQTTYPAVFEEYDWSGPRVRKCCVQPFLG